LIGAVPFLSPFSRYGTPIDSKRPGIVVKLTTTRLRLRTETRWRAARTVMGCENRHAIFCRVNTNACRGFANVMSGDADSTRSTTFY
jgi:hypothetical protein